MGTDILKEQYNLLLENQKKKIKKLQDKRITTTNKNNGNSFDIDDNEGTLNIEREIDKINEIDLLDSSSDDLNIDTKILTNNNNNKKSINVNGSALFSNKNKLKASTNNNINEQESSTLRESFTFADKLRELKDENGRLRKLLSEKDYEISYLKKQLEEEKLAFTGGGVGSDAVATKIVDLSKKIRELNAQLEAERTKNKQLNKNNKELEYKLAQNGNQVNGKNRSNYDDDDGEENEDETQKLIKENKELKDKLNQTSGKMMEYKSQCDILKQDLKKYQRALEKEVGDNVDIKAILSGQSNWKGRQQQIRTLQSKLAELRQQIGIVDNRINEMTMDEEFEAAFMKTGDIGSIASGMKSEQMSMISFSTTKRSALDAKNRDEIKRIEKEKKEQVEKVKREYEALENDFNTMKTKTDGLKARTNVLTNEVKTLREQVKTLLEKGKHDDELIEALLQKQNQMKVLIDELTTKNETITKELDEKTKESQVKSMQDKNLIEQLKVIVGEREKRVKQLEEEMQMMHLREHSNQHLQFILHGNNNNTNTNLNGNNNDQLSQTPGLLNDDDRSSTRNNSRAEFTSTRLASASLANIASNNNINNKNTNTNINNSSSNSRLSGREIASTRHALKATKLNSRPNSANSNVNTNNGVSSSNIKKELEELKAEYHELSTLNKSSEIERTRLLELVKTLQKRLESLSDKLVESENKYNEQRRRCVTLEKQIEKSKLDSTNISNKQKSTAATMMTATLDQYKIEELETSLLIQKDENDALKAALKSTLEAKEEDLRLYVEMLDSTKRVFLDGLKEFKQLTNK